MREVEYDKKNAVIALQRERKEEYKKNEEEKDEEEEVDIESPFLLQNAVFNGRFSRTVDDRFERGWCWCESMSVTDQSTRNPSYPTAFNDQPRSRRVFRCYSLLALLALHLPLMLILPLSRVTRKRSICLCLRCSRSRYLLREHSAIHPSNDWYQRICVRCPELEHDSDVASVANRCTFLTTKTQKGRKSQCSIPRRR